MKKMFHELKAGDVFQRENPLSKEGVGVTFLRTNVGVVNMESWLHVDSHKVRDWISKCEVVTYVGNLTLPKLGKAFGIGQGVVMHHPGEDAKAHPTSECDERGCK